MLPNEKTIFGQVFKIHIFKLIYVKPISCFCFLCLIHECDYLVPSSCLYLIYIYPI